MNSSDLQFLNEMAKLTRQGAVGIGLNHPIPIAAESLISDGYCTMTPLTNPNQVANVPDFFVTLTALGRDYVEAQEIEMRKNMSAAQTES